MSQFEDLVLALRELRGKRLASDGSGGAGQDRSGEERERAAYLQGRRDGEQELRRELAQQQRVELRALEEGVLQSLLEVLPRVARDCESALKQLCLDLARKLVADLPISAALVEQVVREALSQIDQTSEYHVYVHPDDLELLRRAGSRLVEADRLWRCHASPDVSRGGCIVKTSLGTLDAQRESKFELLKKALLK